jgi:hypothetical protein
MIQIANTSNGSDVYIASVLFREFLMIGKRERRRRWVHAPALIRHNT